MRKRFLAADGQEIQDAGELFAWSEERLAQAGITAEIIEDEGPVAFYRPPVPSSLFQPSRRFTWLEFMALFTDAEKLAIAQAAMTNVQVKLWYDQALGASYVDLDDIRTNAGVLALVPAGLLTQARATQILGASH
jgi:hypothetical protein